MPHTEQEHEDGYGVKACPMHDESGHWQDDEAYIDDDRLPIPDNAPTWGDLIAKLRDNKPENDPIVYRFALVFVDAKTGLMNVYASPGQSHNMTINLMSRACAIMAFQVSQEEKMTEHMLRNVVNGGLMPPMFAPDDGSDDDDRGYL